MRALVLKQDGWPQRAIAEALGVSEPAVSQWLECGQRGGRQSGQPGAFVKPAQQRRTELACRQRPAQRVDAMLRSVQARAAEFACPADVDMSNRCGLCGGKRPYADGVQPVDGGARQRQIAFVIAGLCISARGSGFDQGDMAAGRVQRYRQACADQAAADDQDVACGSKRSRVSHARMIRAANPFFAWDTLSVFLICRLLC